MAEIVYPAPLRALDANGKPVASAEAYFYRTDTTTPLTVYADEAGSTAHPSPLVADANGIFASVFNTSAYGVKVDIRNPLTDAILPGYPLNRAIATSTTVGAAAQIGFAPTANLPETNVQSAVVLSDTNWRSANTLQQAELDALGTASLMADSADTDLTVAPNAAARRGLVAAAIAAGVTALTASSSATLDFTWSGSPKKVAFDLDGILPATDGAILHMLVTTDGGATWKTGTTDYSWFVGMEFHGTTNSNTYRDQEDTKIAVMGTVGTGNVGAYETGITGELSVMNPAATSKTNIRGTAGYLDNSGNQATAILHADYHGTTGAVNGVRFLFSSGNIASGTITMTVQA